jgi:YlmC/YmxH family sporulation protein
MTRLHDLRQKEIINVSDGARYGFVGDIEFDEGTGQVTAIVVPGQGKLLGLIGGGPEYIIPWGEIKKVGEDIIIVDCDTRKVMRG